MNTDISDIILKYQTLLKIYEEKEEDRLITETDIKEKRDNLKEIITDNKTEINNLIKELENIKLNEQNIRALDKYLIKGLVVGLIFELIFVSLSTCTFSFNYAIKAILTSIFLVFISFSASAYLFFKKYPNTHFTIYKNVQKYQSLLEYKLKQQKEYVENLNKKLKSTNYQLEKIHNLNTYQKAINYINFIIDYLQNKNFIFDSSYYLISDTLESNPDNISVLESKIETLKLTRFKKEEYL